MRYFPQYKLDDFYRKHYYEGGLNLFQIKAMYKFIGNEKEMDCKFQAGVHGIDLDKEAKKSKNKPTKQKFDEIEKKQDIPLFRDPSEYESMSQEEKEQLTQKMMGKHKQWAQKGTIGS